MENKGCFGQLKYLLGKVIFPGLFLTVVIVEFIAVIKCSIHFSKDAHILPIYVNSYLYIHVCVCIYIPTYVHTHRDWDPKRTWIPVFSFLLF